MYIYIYTYRYIHTYIYIHTYTYTHTYIHTYVREKKKKNAQSQPQIHGRLDQKSAETVLPKENSPPRNQLKSSQFTLDIAINIILKNPYDWNTRSHCLQEIWWQYDFRQWIQHSVAGSIFPQNLQLFDPVLFILWWPTILLRKAILYRFTCLVNYHCDSKPADTICDWKILLAVTISKIMNC